MFGQYVRQTVLPVVVELAGVRGVLHRVDELEAR